MSADNTRSKPRKEPTQADSELERARELKNHQRENLNALVGEQVLHVLGVPGDLLSVQTRRLWEDHYRVNVFIGVNAASAKIADSYFVVADGDGNVVRSTPAIKRRYQK